MWANGPRAEPRGGSTSLTNRGLTSLTNHGVEGWSLSGATGRSPSGAEGWSPSEVEGGYFICASTTAMRIMFRISRTLQPI
jgi:hypothetical protein